MAKTAGRETVTEHKIEEFAEDLGRLLSTAKAKAEGWLGQRQQITKTLTGIRDTASDLLQRLSGGRRRLAAAVRHGGSGPSRPKGSVRKRKMSAKARKAISDAQKRRWAKVKAGEKKQ